ncbi:MAPEG family protein [Tropicimonas marinistellae]|uniref:MAPEG family protein n=1 Tax=Tropicimonas marinistellae TaxID=1739787 RepID=UPI00083148EF|nr:MAPEG family protein [Tropicimonas marinistellae]
MLTVTPIYAGLLGLLFAALSARVILARKRLSISLGDGGAADMERHIRIQGNCAEYAPLGLLLLAIAEMQGMPGWVVHLFGAMLFLGRVTHAWSLSQVPQNLSARVVGMGLTLGMIVTVAMANILHALV